MNQLEAAKTENTITALHEEIHRDSDSIYYHRLHAVILVAKGMSCRQVAELFGDAPRSVAYWVRKFEEGGFSGLSDNKRSGRPALLTKRQLISIKRALNESPRNSGLPVSKWDGKALSTFIDREWGKNLGTRQCQRLLKQLKRRNQDNDI